MRILIVSDTHGRTNNLEWVLEKVKPLDLMIHLGDLEGGEDYIEAIAPCPVQMVAGNNDYFSDLPRQKIIDIGGYKALLVHGHHHGVSFDSRQVKEAARVEQCSIAMHGHTHWPSIDLKDGITRLNPGSISCPRQPDHRPTYILMEIDRFGTAHYTLNYV